MTQKGTSYTSIAMYKQNHIELIENNLGHILTPSVVAFTNDGEVLIGEAVEYKGVTDPG